MTPDRLPPVIALSAVAVLVLSCLRLLLPTETFEGLDEAENAAPSETRSDVAPDPPAAARDAVAHLFDTYVEDGRVIRHDEGGDTVSEGQAWALLLAVAVGDEDHAVAIADWTATHLQRDDHLMAWRWADGQVADPEPAADADLVHAWALSLGAERFGRPAWQVRAAAVAEGLATRSTTPTSTGPLLTAGPWASTSDPAVVNPSYLWPAALRWAATQHPSLAGVEEAARHLLDRLTSDDTPLVPDWVTIDRDGAVSAIGSPADRDATPAHGFDAVRTWIWLASDCDPAVRELAARAEVALDGSPTTLPAVHDLAGEPAVDWRHPAALAGAAAVAHAAGDADRARALLDEATQLDVDHPTYYGAAVTALARVLLDTDLLSSC